MIRPYGIMNIITYTKYMYSQYLPDLIQSNLSFLEKNIEMAQNAHKKSTRYIIIMIFPPCKKNSIRHVPVTFKKCV